MCEMQSMTQARQWVEEHRDELLEDLLNCDLVPHAFKDSLKEPWCAGCWLKQALEGAGLSEDKAQEICFAHGQRCFGGDAYVWAVKYFNEYVTTGQVQDKPGEALAEKINNELFEKGK